MKPLEFWTCQRAQNLKKKSSKIPKNNYAATMVSAARRQIIGGGAPINKSQRRRRPQIVGGGAARPAHGSSCGLAVIVMNCQLRGGGVQFRQGKNLCRDFCSTCALYSTKL